MNHPNLKPKRALVPLGIGIALSLFGDSTLYTVLPDPSYAAQAGVSLAAVGVILSANRFVRLFFNSLAGALFDRLPRRKLMIPALILGLLATMIYALGHGAALMIAGRVLWGAAWSGIWIGANAMALDISDDNNRGAISGQLQMWFSIGIAATTFTGGLFTDLFTYRGGLWVSAGLGLLAVLTWLVFLPETRPALAAAPIAAAPAESPANHFPWKKILLAAAPLFVVRFSGAGVLNATTILWLAKYFDGGISFGEMLIPLATLTGAFAAARVLIGTASAPFIGALSDLLKQRWAVLALLLATAALGIALMSLPWLAAAILGTLLAALTTSGVPTLSIALIGDQVAPERHSRSLGLVYTVGDLGAMIGPIFALGLVGTLGISKIYLICAGLYAASAVLAGGMILKQPKRR